jgi:molybdate transport repressor ModE-like protein
MKKISIRPVWTLQDDLRPPLPPRLIELLVQVQAEGSLRAACLRLDLSYRHGWDLVRQGEAHFASPLLLMTRGRGSTLTTLGEKLVWADHRITARLGPVLDSLASELAGEIGRVLSDELPARPAGLCIHASHGFAVEMLVDRLGRSGLDVERRYGSSLAAAASLHEHRCDVAGLHIPLGPAQASALSRHARFLREPGLRLIDIATRRQGLMIAPGNPKKIYELSDLQRADVRFVNRQSDSGTRFLLEDLLQRAGIDPSRIAGFEQGEATHAAVAACVASGLADVGFGLETPARQFRLDFLPLARERYFLLCHAAALDTPAMQSVLAELRSPSFARDVNALAGYAAEGCGQVLPLHDAFVLHTVSPRLGA